MKPNVLCVGFAKCGTTTLYDVMKQHKDIYVSGIKEPMYYGHKKLLDKGFKWYEKRYYPKRIKQKIIMEVNPVIGKYISAEEISKNYGQNTKIIFIVRNPIKRLYSNFIMNLKKGDCFSNIDDNIGNENQLFDRWVLENFVDDNGKVIENSIVPHFCKSGNYYKNIKNYIDVFGKKQVKVVIFEDLIKNPKIEFEKIFKFIGLKPQDNINYNVISNEGNRIPYNKLSIKLTKKTFRIWENFIANRIPYISYKFSSRLNNLMWKIPNILSKKTSKKDIPYISNIILNKYYKNICIDLGNLIGKDLIKKWNIKTTDISEEDQLAIEIRKKYIKELINIDEEYYDAAKKYNIKRFNNIIKHQNKTLIDIINTVLDKYNKLDNIQCIMLSGSLANTTNIYDSDIDLNIFSNKENAKLIAEELKISYILARIMNYNGSERIHSIMAHTKSDIEYKYKLNGDQLVINDKYKCPYFFRENYKETIEPLLNSSRSCEKLLEYIDEKINNKEFFNNWIINFKVLKDNGYYDNFKNEINKRVYYIKKTITKEDIINKISDIEKSISTIYLGQIDNHTTIRDLKKMHKTKIIKPIRDLIFLVGISDLNQTKKENYQKELYNVLYKQLFIIMRLKIILKEWNYDFSSHSTAKINIKDIKQKSKRIIGHKNILKGEKKNIRQLFDIMKQIKEEYYV